MPTFPANQISVANTRSNLESNGTTPVNLAPIFKEFFYLPFVEAYPKDLFLYERIQKENAEGDKYAFKAHFGTNASVGSYAEQDDFGTVGHQQYIDAEVGFRLYKGEIEVTNFMIKATQGNKAAYLNTWTSESKGVLRDLRKKLNNHMLASTRANVKDLDSLGFIIDDGQVNGATGYANIPFATNTWWKPYVNYSATPRSISIAFMQDMTENLESEAREADITAILTHKSHQNDYGNLYESQRRQVNTMTIKGGFTTVEFEGKPVIAVPSIPTGDMYFLDESELRWAVLNDMDTLEPSVMRDARHLVVTHYSNLVCRDLRKQGRIANLT